MTSFDTIVVNDLKILDVLDYVSPVGDQEMLKLMERCIAEATSKGCTHVFTGNLNQRWLGRYMTIEPTTGLSVSPIKDFIRCFETVSALLSAEDITVDVVYMTKEERKKFAGWT